MINNKMVAFQLFILLYITAIIVLIVVAPLAFIVTIVISLLTMAFGFANAEQAPPDKEI